MEGRSLGTELVFLNTVRGESVEKVLKGGTDKVLFSFSAEAAQELRRRKVTFNYTDDLFPDRIASSIDKLGTVLGESWDEPFRSGMEYHDVPVGRVFARELSFYFKDGLQCFTMAAQAFRKYKPSRIICSPPIPYGKWSAVNAMPMQSHLPFALEALCKERGVPIEFIEGVENGQRFELKREQRPFFDLAVKGRNTLKDTLKKLGMTGKKGEKRILTVMLKPGLLAKLKELGADKGLVFLEYNQAEDLFRLGSRSGRDAVAQKMEGLYDKALSHGDFLPLLPKALGPARSVLEIDVRYMFQQYLPGVLEEIDRMRSVLANMSADLLLCLEDMNPLSKARVAVAEAQGIPSVVLQHGIYSIKWSIFSYPRARYNLIWGPAYIPAFLKEGIPKENIFVTGVTSLDIIYEMPDEVGRTDEVLEKLGVPKDKKVVLWTTSPLPVSIVHRSLKRYVDEIREVFEVMKDRPETLVVKPHQMESAEVYQAIAKEVGFEPIITDRYLSHLLRGCDVVMAGNSTVGLQVIIAKKPFVFLSTQPPGDLCSYTDYGVAEPVFDVKDLSKALDKALGKKKITEGQEPDLAVDKFLEEFAQRRDGSGMAEVIKRLLEIIEKDGPGKKGPVKDG